MTGWDINDSAFGNLEKNGEILLKRGFYAPGISARHKAARLDITITEYTKYIAI